MKMCSRHMLAGCAVFAALVSVHALAAPTERVYLTFRPGAKAAAKQAVRSVGGQVNHEFEHLDTLAVQLPVAALAGLSRNPHFVEIERDPLRQWSAVQVVPYGVEMVRAPEAQALIGRDGFRIKVGVVDSGVYAAHQEFAGVIMTGEPDYGPLDQRTWYRDFDSHGTHVAGTLTAMYNNIGIVGVAPEAVDLHAVKVFGDTGQWVYSSDVLAAVHAAAAAGCRVINLSLGGNTSSKIERRAFAALHDSGHLLVAAAGNIGTTAYDYPASYDSVISVTAVDENKQVAAFAQKNAQVELAAPGVRVLGATSYRETVGIAALGASFDAVPVHFSARAERLGVLVDGGDGTGASAAWNGRIVLVTTGALSLHALTQAAQTHGALACVLADDGFLPGVPSLGAGQEVDLPCVVVTGATGAALRNAIGSEIVVTSLLDQPTSGYAYLDGTSIATPHVSGVAALIWSRYPAATAAQVRRALQESAEDLGAPGRDSSYGFGLVQADAALEKLAALLGQDVTPPRILDLATEAAKGKVGTFEITWRTHEPARSVVLVAGSTYSNQKLQTTHRLSIKGAPGSTYTVDVTCSDAAGNTASASIIRVN